MVVPEFASGDWPKVSAQSGAHSRFAEMASGDGGSIVTARLRLECFRVKCACDASSFREACLAASIEF